MTESNYDAVLFDAAETLFTTRGTVGDLYAASARDFGSSATPAEIQEAFDRQFRRSGPVDRRTEKEWWKGVVQRVFTDVGMVNDFDGLFERIYDRFRDAGGWSLFPETVETLSALKAKGLKLGIISNFDSRIYSVLDALEIRPFFDTVTISSESGFAKPHPGIFQSALRALAVAPWRALFVGDSLSDDVEAGDKAGLATVLLDRNNRYAGISFPRIQTLAEIPERLETLV
ncbi:MAG TPA: HAD-IA family hydrolase [Terriglobia bacterium]|nr:HAD-IA family hydrolase [Terriglobia bacterium]